MPSSMGEWSLKQPELEARRWMAQARDDLEFIQWLLGEGRGFEKGCFIAQQSAEKALKAVLYLGGARTVLGHSVADLLERVLAEHPRLAALSDDARQLDRFYIPTRYPNGLPGGAPFESFTREDLEKAVGMAGRIVAGAAGIVTS